MNTNKGNIARQARIVQELLARSTKQVIEPEIMSKIKFDTVIGKEAWNNGVTETITQGINSIEDYNGTDVTIDTFNKKSNPVYTQIFWNQAEKQTSFEIENEQLMNGFTSDEVRNKFIAGRLNASKRTWDKYFHDLYPRFLLGLQTIEKIAADGTKTNEPVYYDSEISISITNTTKTIDKMTEDNMVDALEAMRNDLMNKRVMSTSHTKFTSDSSAAANTKFGMTHDKRKLFPFCADANEFVIVWNSKFKNKLASLTAKLFNPNDILLQTEELNVPFDQYDFYSGLTTNQKASINSTIAFIVHKKALRIGFELNRLTDVIKMPYKQVFYETTFYGFMRNVLYPIVKVKVA